MMFRGRKPDKHGILARLEDIDFGIIKFEDWLTLEGMPRLLSPRRFPAQFGRREDDFDI